MCKILRNLETLAGTTSGCKVLYASFGLLGQKVFLGNAILKADNIFIYFAILKADKHYF
jgi:hypothetical protein